MDSRSRTRSALAALATLAAVAPVAFGVTHASAAPRGTVEYDALGDSYASGYGVPPYDGPCGRSQTAYAVQVDGRMKIDLDDFVACAGATTTSMVAEGQLGALDEDTDLVTLQIGGNDIGWSQAVTACLGGTDQQCTDTLALIRARITTQLPALLDSVYDQVAAAAPDAHVVVVGYPRLFSPEYGPYLGASVAEQVALNEGADLLNAVIAEAAAEHGFQFVDVTKRFTGHGVNSPDAWLLGPLDAGAFHPDAEGYQAYTAALTAAINPSRLK
jgi:lysophospholipase L1-like esterase